MQALAQEFLKTPVEIKFGEGNVLNANKNITQIIKVRLAVCVDASEAPTITQSSLPI